MDKIDGYRAIILDNIEYDLIVNQQNKARLDEIVDIMLECVYFEAETQIWVGLILILYFSEKIWYNAVAKVDNLLNKFELV